MKSNCHLPGGGGVRAACVLTAAHRKLMALPNQSAVCAHNRILALKFLDKARFAQNAVLRQIRSPTKGATTLSCLDVMKVVSGNDAPQRVSPNRRQHPATPPAQPVPPSKAARQTIRANRVRR